MCNRQMYRLETRTKILFFLSDDFEQVTHKEANKQCCLAQLL